MKGPKAEDPYFRFALAGTAATVIVEAMTHAVDTMNMRAKVIDGPKVYAYKLFRLQTFFSLFRGI